MGHLSADNIVLTGRAHTHFVEFKLFNFSEAVKYGKKYILHKDDKKIGISPNEKKVDSKTDSRVFGSLMAVLL